VKRTHLIVAGIALGVVAGVGITLFGDTAPDRQPARVAAPASPTPVEPPSTEPTTVAGARPRAEQPPTTGRAAAGSPSSETAPGSSAPGDRGGAAADADVLGSSDVQSLDYDPVAVLATTRDFPLDIARREPRVAAFAVQREAYLRPRIERRLRGVAPGPFDLTVECFTSSCKVIVKPEGVTFDQMNDILAELQKKPRLADAVQPLVDGGPPAPRLGFIFVFSRAHRDHDGFARWVADNERQAAR
jgi:hypothetical protein